MAGNWKMYKTPSETRAFFEKFLPLVSGANDRDIVICPPYVNLPAAVNAVSGSNVEIGGQNLFWETKEGAYTGEINGRMLKETGATWVIIGHSERRQYFGETDETVFKRIGAALQAGLKPIVCVGEMLRERESGETNWVLERQFTHGVSKLAPEEFSKIVIAYEPVWAIGTGKTATPEIAAEAHAFIRSLVQAKYGTGDVRILYGGSVKPDNIKGLMAQDDIDGVLVGGASLDPTSFGSITVW